MIKTVVTAVTLALASLGSAQAAQLNLGLAGANVFTLGDFKASSSDVEGSIIAAGNVTFSGYSVNANNVDAAGHYSLIVGGNLDASNGSINNGDVWVGGTSKIAQSVGGKANVTVGGTAPGDLLKLSAYEKERSLALNALSNTGSAKVEYQGLVISGSASKGNTVEVIDITSAQLDAINNFKFSDLVSSKVGGRSASSSTLILNVSGTNVTLNGGYQDLAKYNVLFNFYEATTLTINTGVWGSILAPLATVTSNNGVVNGDVVVGNWLSNTQINTGNAFAAVDVNGLAVSAVPEANTYAMLLAGLGMIGFIGLRRRKSAKLEY
ncbi:collagen-binding domain-containing protein [Duganella sp. P38]|uniref:choice-of-anchor A family protein n=1 Tax=Duganella sp. P38 TaxID=3423949 RepID=UPI003D7936C3